MGNYVNKFGFYEFLALLVPGTVFSYAVMYLIPYWLCNSELLNNCEISGDVFLVISIVGSFLVGMILQELGTIWDRNVGYRLLYGGNPDARWMTDCAENNCKRTCWVTRDSDGITKAKALCEAYSVGLTQKPERCFYYMLNTLEANGVGGKAEKMMIASELSRSLAFGCSLLMLLHIGIGIFGTLPVDQYYVGILAVLAIMILLFTIRKVRYERFRFSTVIRTFVIFKENEKQNKD